MYSPYEIRYIVKNYLKRPLSSVARGLGRTEYGLAVKMRQLVREDFEGLEREAVWAYTRSVIKANKGNSKGNVKAQKRRWRAKQKRKLKKNFNN